jgi:uncharacterized protein (DUF488 family)
MTVLFTIGYQGQSIATFCDILKAHGITMIVDVRERPFSRKPDFNKKRLSAHLATEGIAYAHLVELGTPKPIRDEVRRSKNYAAFFATIEPQIEAQTEALQTALELARAQTCALLCFESAVDECHRRTVAEALVRRSGGDLEVVHL